MIVKSAHITSASSEEFCKRYNKVVNDFQSEGLTVEIQYQAVNTIDEYNYLVYTALIIGRKTGGTICE